MGMHRRLFDFSFSTSGRYPSTHRSGLRHFFLGNYPVFAHQINMYINLLCMHGAMIPRQFSDCACWLRLGWRTHGVNPKHFNVLINFLTLSVERGDEMSPNINLLWG